MDILRYSKGRYVSQKGIVLVTVLLVLAIVVFIFSSLFSRQKIDIQSNANALIARQGWHYALGGERWALQILLRDLSEEASDRDHLGEYWARPYHHFPFYGGDLFVKIEDANSRFNLNNIVTDKGTVSQRDYERLQKISEGVGGSKAIADDLVSYVSGLSMNKSSSSNATNQNMPINIVDTSELLNLKSVNPEIYTSLLPFVISIPGKTRINVNTAKVPVIKNISPIIDADSLSRVVERQKKEGYLTLEDFAFDVIGDEVLGEVINDLSVTSDFFIITVKAVYMDRNVHLQSLVYRNRVDKKIEVFQRQKLNDLDLDIFSDE